MSSSGSGLAGCPLLHSPLLTYGPLFSCVRNTANWETIFSQLPKDTVKLQLHVNHFRFSVALGSKFGPIANLRQPLNFSANISVKDGDLLR